MMGGCLAAFGSSAIALKPTPTISLLDSLYIATEAETATQVCATRFDDSASTWRQVHRRWRERHAAVLAELQQLDREVRAATAAASSAIGPEQLDALNRRRTASLSDHLDHVPAGEAHARCDALMIQLHDDVRTLQSLDFAREGARQALGMAGSVSR